MDILLKHYHKIIQTEEDVEALKSHILNLAISGKLNINSSKSDNANATLDIITKRKDELIKSGKIRKQKQPEKIIEAELPFTIPKDWVWVRLGTIAYQIHYGHTASATDIDTGVKFLRITDIQNNKVSWKDVPYCEIDERRLNSLLLKEGDILIARTGGTIGKTFLIDSVDYPSVFASYLIRVQLSEKVDEQYIKYFLESPFYWKQLINFSQGTGQPNVNATSLSNLLIPLPPVEQQENIVEKIKELFESCNQLIEKIRFKNNSSLKLNTTVFERLQDASTPNRKKDLDFAIQNMKRLCNTKDDVQLMREGILSLAIQGKLVYQDPQDEPATVLIKKIEEEKERLIKANKIRRSKKLLKISNKEIPYDLPKGWRWEKLGNITEIRRGASPRPIKKYLTESDFGIPWIKIGDSVVGDKYITSTKEKITPEGAEKSVYLESGSLVMSNSMSFGRAYILKIDGCIHDGWLSLKIYNELIFDELLLLFLNASFKQFEKKAVGTGVRNLNIDRVRNSMIPVPPLNEQRRIAQKSDELFLLCDELEKQIDRYEIASEKLRTSVLKGL